MKKEIQSLVELQAVDLEIGKIEIAMSSGNQELEKQRGTIDGRKTAIAEYAVKLEAFQKRHSQIEEETEAGLTTIKDRQTKMMNVQTNREYQSILKEIEDAKNANKQREDELVRLMEQTEFLQKKIDEQTAICEKEEKSLDDDIKRVEKTAADLSAQKEKVLKSRLTRAKKVSESILKKYEQLRAHRNGLAVASVTSGVCHGCYMNIPPQLFNELMREESLLSCPTCNRMIYHKPESEEA